MTAEAEEAFRRLYIRLARRKRFFKVYVKRSLKRALAHALIGFISGYTVGLQATQALSIAFLSGLTSAVAYFLYKLLK